MSDIDIDTVNRKCYKCKDHLQDNLNIVYNESNSLFILWNKYQIFLYEDFNFETATRIIIPEFQIHKIVASGNYLVCLDCSGNIHTVSLKFKNPAQKRLKCSFQAREQGIINCIQYSSETVLSLESDIDTYFLCLHRISPDFQLDKKIALSYDTQLPHLIHEKCILYSQVIAKDDFDRIKANFHLTESQWKDHSIVLISFDKISVYFCLYSTKITEDEVPLVKLYTCPSEICNIATIGTESINILIVLTSGTLICLPLNKTKQSPKIVHLNTAIYRFVILRLNDTIIYTDGISMWKAENIFSKNDITFNQFFMKQPKDFLITRDQVICSTFTRMIYKFSIQDETLYIKAETTDEYCSAEKLFNNADYLHRIMKELEKNNELIKKVNDEENYITTLSLSKRQDIMDTVLDTQLFVYENYEEVTREYSELTLTEELEEYFKPESFLFLITIKTLITQLTLNKVLSNLFGDSKIHIKLSAEQKLLKTTSIKLLEPLKKLQILIPLSREQLMMFSTQINVDITLVSDIPGALDEHQKVWVILYKKLISLNSEHFIKTNDVPSKKVYLKEPPKYLENLILLAACNYHGNLFKFTDISTSETNANELSFYVKLPKYYKETFNKEDYLKKHFNTGKAIFFHKWFTNEDFLKSRNNLCFEIGHEKVKIEIVNDDFCAPLLKITSSNIKIAYGIRNFFADFIYSSQNVDPSYEFVNYALYTTTENLQKAIKNCINGSSEEDLLPLAEQFQKNVIGALPF